MQAQPPPSPKPSNTRKWLMVGLALIIGWGIFAVSATQMLKLGEMEAPRLEPPGIPLAADFSWSLLDLDGNPVDFASFKGRPILLNVWATWCGPCLKEMPSIANLAASDDLQGRNIAFVCVSTDQSAETLRGFMKDKNWKMTVLRATSVPPAFQTEGIPATFLIAPDGRIASAEMGAAQWDDPTVVYYLQKLARQGK